jgi:putative oxidoreductase
MIARAQDGTLLAARLLLAAALLPTGIARALNVSGFALTLAANGMPFPNGVATAAVVIQVFGPLALILGVLPRLTGLALAVFAATTAFVLHAFWQFIGPAAIAERTLMLADLGLAGGFLMYALVGPGNWSWQGWRAGAAGPAPGAKPAAKPSAGKSAKSAPARGGKRQAGRSAVRAAA